jgi:BCD family chlorophyll transporter-like MFS transporter
MTLSWFSIVRLGLIQMCLGAIVVLMTSTLNRLMVVELSLPALMPGFLVALHYGVQLSRPNWGYLSDVGGKRSFWVNSGMALLVTGAVLASFAIGIFPASYVFGMVLSVIAYILIGFGVGARRHICFGAAGQLYCATSACCRGNNYMADDDLWHCGDGWHRWIAD